MLKIHVSLLKNIVSNDIISTERTGQGRKTARYTINEQYTTQQNNLIKYRNRYFNSYDTEHIKFLGHTIDDKPENNNLNDVSDSLLDKDIFID